MHRQPSRGLSGGPLSHKEVLEVVAAASANLAGLLAASDAAHCKMGG